jgi:7 transmembrane receptor (rhodopsin family)
VWQVNTTELRHVVFVLYLLTFGVGAVGNTLTIVALSAANSQRRSAAVCFMLNLAVADDLFIASLPFKAHSTLTGRWQFGAAACKLLSVCYAVSVHVS